MTFKDKLLNQIKLKKNDQESQCKGRFYRFFVTSFLSSYNTIEVKKSLRPLKRDSCSGCEKCGWVDEFLLEDVSEYINSDYLENMEHKKKYQLIGKWIPGPYEYPDEGELEIDFIEIDE